MLNIAEGAEEHSVRENTRFYRIAKCSARTLVLNIDEKEIGLTDIDPEKDLQSHKQ